MKTDNKAIGKTIKHYRQQKRITQEEFAEAIGLSPGHVSRLERGIKRPSLETLMEISRTLDVALDTLLSNPIRKEMECDKETSDLLFECNAYERKILVETIKAMKEAMIRNRNIVKKG